jgi:hypothetical protein
MMCTAWTFLATAPVLAANPEALDAEFLDYLAACEGKDDNWTVVASEKQRRKVAEKKPPKESPPADKAEPPLEVRP